MSKQKEFIQHPKGQTTKKMLGDRIVELTKSLQVIRDSLSLIQQGKTYQIIPLCGQLRALLTDKSKKNKPLLIDLAILLQKKLSVFVMPDTAESELPSDTQPLLHIAGLPFTLSQEFPLQKEMDISDLLSRKLIYFKTCHYSIKEIIEFYANKSGGAHYSTEMPLHFAELLNFVFNGLPVLDQVLIPIAYMALEIGIGFIKALVDFEMHAVLHIPDQKIDQEAFILDNKYPNSTMRFFLALNKQKKLIVGLNSLDNIEIVIPINSLIDLKTPFYFSIIFLIEKNLSTRIELHINGNCLVKNEYQFPMIVISDIAQYDSYFNRSFDQKGQGLEIGFSQLCCYDRELQPLEKAKNYIYFDESRQDKDIKFLLFSKGSYGHAAVGERNYKMVGEVKYISFSDIDMAKT